MAVVWLAAARFTFLSLDSSREPRCPPERIVVLSRPRNLAERAWTSQQPCKRKPRGTGYRRSTNPSRASESAVDNRSMDRAPYQLPFTANRVPAWRCPVCQVGHLSLAKESLVNAETAASRREHAYDAWEPDWIRSVFACVFVCSSPSCKEPVACSGTGQVNRFEFEDEEHGWAEKTEDVFTPLHFHPPLVLMDIPAKCPPGVTEHLQESFNLYFIDPGAALNSARAALEVLMTDLGVKRFLTTNGKKRSLNLHQRIEQLPARFQEQKDLILAVKWLGNAGSHSGPGPAAGDVRVAYDMLEHVLSEIYEEKIKKLKAMAKSVNEKKGPVK